LGIAGFMRQAVAVARRLSALVDDNNANASALSGTMDGAVGSLERLGRDVAARLEGMARVWRDVMNLLAEAGRNIQDYDRILSQAHAVMAGVETLAGSLGATADQEAEIQQDVHRLLLGRYTMDSERIIHSLFAEGSAMPVAGCETDACEIEFF